MHTGSCVVLVPVGSSIEPETEECLYRLSGRGYPIRYLRGCSQVDLARSVMATRALDDGFSETLWIDSDIVFDPDDVERLRAHGRPFTAGLYVKKGRPEFAAKFRYSGPVVFGVGGELLEMEYVGMGFAHVRRGVYEAVERACQLPRTGGGYDPGSTVIPYFIPSLAPTAAGGWEYLSEDASFCSRARAAGFPPVADTALKLGHGTGCYKYTWDDLNPRPALTRLDICVGTPDGS